jgi:hypothetical protein
MALNPSIPFQAEVLTQVRRLVEQLPPQTAELELQRDDHPGTTLRITPSRACAAPIQLMVSEYGVAVSVGMGSYRELHSSGSNILPGRPCISELIAICEAVFRGGFEEETRDRNAEIVSTSLSLSVEGKLVGFDSGGVLRNRLRRHTAEKVFYCPYVGESV